MPYNHITKLQYQGGNIAILASAGYKSHEWATFLQWKTAGFKVKKGSKASYIRTFIDGTKTVKDKKTGKSKVVAGSIARGYAVFNIEQVEKAEPTQKTNSYGKLVAA